MKIMNMKRICFTAFYALIPAAIMGMALHFCGGLDEAIAYIRGMNPVFLLGFALVVLMTWCAAGCIWRPYLKEINVKILSSIQYEINFVDVVLPYMNTPGKEYGLKRLKALGVSTNRANALFSFRYGITIFTKWVEILAAIIWILSFDAKVQPNWAIWLTLIVAVTVVLAFLLGGVVYALRLRVPRRLFWSARWKRLAEKTQQWLDELFQVLDIIFDEGPLALAQSLVFGMFYSLFEVLPFYIVASATGHPELFLPVIIASGAGIIAGIAVPTPMGVIGFELAMILFLCGMGISVTLATAVVITTRVLILLSTATFGIPFWVNGVKEIKKVE